MAREKKLDIITIVFAALSLVFAGLLISQAIKLENSRRYDLYKDKLFEQGKVHSINIFIEDKEKFFDEAIEEKYVPATVVIDGDSFNNVGLRTKGNNSKNLVERYGLKRHSLKIEFDHYEESSYYGLDKISLDSSFQDNSYLKSFLTMDMMNFMGVHAPLTSYTWVTINGEPYGLFLAIEEIEEGFARRNFGLDHGRIYKSSYRSLRDPNYDIKLIYSDDDFESYSNFFNNAKFPIDDYDKRRLIKAIEILNTGENLDKAVDIDQVLRYFVVHGFVVNLDSYLGPTAHNYFLYEKDGRISMLPWDYNLAFSTYSLGMPNPINDVNLYVNFPYMTPVFEEILEERPLFTKLMENEDIKKRYEQLYELFLREYIESGHLQNLIDETEMMIHDFVKRDPTAFMDFEDHKLGIRTINEFINLRAQSIRGQLEGTIPNTLEGQRQDSTTRIDASHIRLEDMGEIDDLKDGYH